MPPLSATREQGALATSIFWGALLAGRLLSIPIALCVPLKAMVVGELSLALLSCAALASVGQASFAGACASLAGLGLGCAALYPAGIMLARQRAPVSGAAVSRFIACGLVGTMLAPSAVGALLDGRPWVLAYAELGFVVVQTACYSAVAALPLYSAASASPSSTSSTHEVELKSVEAPSRVPPPAPESPEDWRAAPG